MGWCTHHRDVPGCFLKLPSGGFRIGSATLPQAEVMTDTHETQTLPTEPERTSFWLLKPTRWIAGGLGAAALLVGGIGLGAAVADDDDDDRPVATKRANDASAVVDASQAPAPARVVTYGAKDAKALSGVLASALKEANGTPTSMEAHRNGTWSVDFEAANGDETTVLVAADGSASVVRTEAADADDANDPAPAGALDDKTLAAAVDAAFAEAQGVVVGIDLDDDPVEAYSVEVLASNGTEIEIDLNSTFDVTQVDVDQD